MINLRGLRLTRLKDQVDLNLGSVGYLAIFAWSLCMVMLAPPRYFFLTAGLSLLVAALVYPRSFQRLMRLRWLGLIAILALPPVFLFGEVDRSLAGISYSSEGMFSGFQIALRMVVVLIAVDGLAASVDIISITGLLERLGLHGLGFSMGVALNLLPSLQQSALNAWRSLWMRGGLRKQRWRGLRLLLLTVITNALYRAEEIALTAEARAFSPRRCRALAVKVGKLDSLAVILALLSVVILAWIR